MSGNGKLRGCGTVGEGARGGEAEMLLLGAVVIDESEAPPMRGQAGRQRVIGDTGAADERHDRADIDQILGLDAEQMQPRAVRCFADERYPGQAQEAGWIRRPRESFEEGGLDEIEIDRSLVDRRLLVMRQMRCLPLNRLAGRPVMAKLARMMVAVTVMMVAVPVVVVMIVVHGQKLTGLSMMDLCLPRLPWATIEPSASTTTRTPKSAVMSEVS
jgi:hypothetical protein